MPATLFYSVTHEMAEPAYLCDIFGHRVLISADTLELLRLWHEAFSTSAPTPVRDRPLPDAEPLLAVGLRLGKPEDIGAYPPPSPERFLGWNAGFHLYQDGFLATMSSVAWARYCHEPLRQLDIWISDPRMEPSLLSNFAFTPALSIALGDFGLYTLHAAAVARDNRAILIAGPSGSGKTTTALLLAYSGFDLLSDDMVVYHAASGCVRPLWQKPHIRPSAVALFPQLRDVGCQPPDPQVSAKPEALVVPEVSASEVTLEKMPQAQALSWLLQVGAAGLLPYQRVASFEAIGGLVRSCPAYHLRLAPDPATITKLLRPLLE